MFSLVGTAHAQTATPTGAPSLAAIGQFAPLLLIFVVFYFLLIRPQQVAGKKLRETLAALKRGDRVVTGGGILGVVQKVGDGELDVEIAPNVRVTVLRDTVTGLVPVRAAND